MVEALSPALKAASDAVLAVASQLSVDDVLQRLALRLLETAVGGELLDRCYREAIRRGCLWHEFGDSHLILPEAAGITAGIDAVFRDPSGNSCRMTQRG